MRWVFDLGNTRLKAAPLGRDGRPGTVVALDHRAADFPLCLAELLPTRIDTAYLASVVDEDRRISVLEALVARCTRISLARTAAVSGPLRVAYRQPSRLGVDRFLAMLAVSAAGGGAALVCGVGTALTIDLVDAQGRHRGGRIAPSPTLMREALHWRVPHLPEHGGDYQEFAVDSADALASGCEGAAVALIARSLEQAAADPGSPPRLYLHGGGAEALGAHLPAAILAPHLVLEGLAAWAALECDG